jgi:hypothetical protein
MWTFSLTIFHSELCQRFEEFPSSEGFADRESVMVMNNCPSQVNKVRIAIVISTLGRIMIFAPHTPNIFQVFYLSLFGILTKRRELEWAFSHDDMVAKCFLAMDHDLAQTIVEVNIWKAL